MRLFRSQIVLGIGLLTVSTLLYTLHYSIFRDIHHITIYFIGDLAFLFIQVFIVTLVIEGVLNERERLRRLEKLRMVIDAFFSDVGRDLLRRFCEADPEIDAIRHDLTLIPQSDAPHLNRVKQRLATIGATVSMDRLDLVELHQYLDQKRESLLRLMENPTVLEHETFTDLLRALFHLGDELAHRPGFDNLPDADIEHIAADIKRVYRLLAVEWAEYLLLLKVRYPYLYSLAIRLNPFGEKVSAIVD